MEQVTIYGRSSCGFCARARDLCETRNIPYVWVDMIEKGMSKQDIAEKIGRPVHTVPQILVGNHYVGGFDQFYAYVREHDAALAR
ncbi:GrxA family glutaredoxin [Marinobacter sp.]|uniref:GrxA family glutaredoxin n=1 Tax=Marinobacter sp. TaxID=50741 RepID=UPI003A928E16